LDIIHARKLLKETQQPLTLEQAQDIVEHGALPHFVRLLQSPNADVSSQSMKALGQIAGTSPIFRDLVLRNGALDVVLSMICKASDVLVLRDATRTLRNLCCGRPSPPFSLVSAALCNLANLLHSDDIEVLSDACWSLAGLTDGPPEFITVAIRVRMVEQLVTLLMHESSLVVTQALRVVRNITSGDDLHRQAILDSGAIPHVMDLLSHPKRAVRKHSCSIICNLTMGSSDQIAELSRHRFIPIIVPLLQAADRDIKKLAIQIVRNVATAGFADLQDFRDEACIRTLLDLLSPSECVEEVPEVLDILGSIMKASKTREADKALLIKQIEHIARDYYTQARSSEAVLVTSDALKQKSEAVRHKARAIMEHCGTSYASPKRSASRQVPKEASLGSRKATNILTPRTLHEPIDLASRIPADASVQHEVGETSAMEQTPSRKGHIGSAGIHTGMIVEPPTGSIFGSVFGGNDVAVQTSCGNIFGGAEYSPVDLSEGIFHFGSDVSAPQSNSITLSPMCSSHPASARFCEESSGNVHATDKHGEVDATRSARWQNEELSEGEDTSTCTSDDLDAHDSDLLAPQEASFSWEWPLTRVEKKTRVSELERNIQLMDKQKLMEELEDLREFRKQHEAAWRQYRRQRRNSIG
jgi:hypothetical protein